MLHLINNAKLKALKGRRRWRNDQRQEKNRRKKKEVCFFLIFRLYHSMQVTWATKTEGVMEILETETLLIRGERKGGL